jgi:hypothetical protein
MALTRKSGIRSMTVSGFLVAGLLAGVGLTLGTPSRAAADRSLYLTKGTFDGNEARTACGKNYHMASLPEIFNLSVFQYNTTLGFTEDDSGQGAPQENGWIHTGGDSNTGSTPGQGNCAAWTSQSSGDYGTLTRFTEDWESTTSRRVQPWKSDTDTCNNLHEVWCVSNQQQFGDVQD